MPGQTAPHNLHTAGNAVPPVDDTDLGDVLDDLEGFHPGIDLIRDGIRLIATSRLTTAQTQTLCSALAGAKDVDVLTAIGLLVARLTTADTNPALHALPFEQQKTTALHGERLLFDLADDDLHQHASEAAAAITGT
ncbi:hypothetical protein [Streptomyces scabiei]|uniref:hypothetical protein n=1 Tax=Streptomyces scabiei TaxID=1930 RepID=UPI0029B2A042|nr:hypothetical protein [Streptomyces scabiei]MDX2800108.1 hypothetical protein [Streptomyces scabiei]MDX3125389.1 hypothetical protein [Streptomyces scabiei]MDX3283223.1 hypothetical protein [Streptomyces scabiei]